MDQKELRALEYRCVQEELPPCTASCPIHVDVKKFTGSLSRGEWDNAWEVLTRTMPLPGIVARVCDHPCEMVCNRGEAGGSIAVSELERACVDRINRKVKPPAVPKKRTTVAVIGVGLSGLTAAWDLLNKGYRVTILVGSDPAGTVLRMFSRFSLPRPVVDAEIDGLRDSGVELRTVTAEKDRNWLTEVGREFDAVYVALDCETVPAVREVSIDPLTGATDTKGVFAGGYHRSGHDVSPIRDVSEGRRGAVSIDRFLQNVSLTAARENEAPRGTRLYVNMQNVTAEPRLLKADNTGTYTEQETLGEARRCIQCECMECVRNCLYLERFNAYPKRYIREIYNNETILIGSHGQTNRLITSCSLCGLCAEVCPNDVSMADVCLEGRKSLVHRGKMPPSFHDFALRDMAFSNGEHCALVRHEPNFHYSAFMFFPGCQLSGSSPEHVERTYDHLRRHLAGGVGIILRCCGAPAHWAARDDLFDSAAGELKGSWEEADRPVMIVACPTCYTIFKEHLPDVPVTSLWELLADIGLPPAEKTASRSAAVSVHDPCTSRHNDAMQESVRTLVFRLGCTTEELDLSRDRTECCGFGGLMSDANPALAGDVARRRGRESAVGYVTYCAMCRDALESTGKRIVHILDLVFDGHGAWDRAGTRRPGHSQRRENRSKLREKMLGEIFGEKGREMERYEEVKLAIPPEVRDRMEERRILTEDVQKVIAHAREGGARFFNNSTGRWLASFTPHTVTYWVEYAGDDNGYTVYNAYSHRMQVQRKNP